MRPAVSTSLADVVRRPHPMQTKFQAIQQTRRERGAMIADLRATIARTRRYVEEQERMEASIFTPILANLIEQLVLIDRLEKSL